MSTLLRIIIVIILTGSFATAQNKKSDREVAGLIGPVKSVQSSSTDYSGETIAGEGFMKYQGDLVFYDASGAETERKPVSDFGESMGTISRTFNEDGLVGESRWFDGKNKLMRRDVFSYSNGKLIETLTYNGAGRLVEKTVRSYDHSGKLGAEIYYDPDKVVARTVYKYNDTNQPAEISFFMADGSKATAPVGPCLGAHRVTYDYNEKGQTISKVAFEDDGTQKRSYRWKYDTTGNIMEYITETKGSTVRFVYKYEFDTKGNWTKRTATGTSLEKGLDVFGKTPTPYVRSTVTSRQIIYY